MDTVDLSQLHTGNVQNMGLMFSESGFKTLDLSHLDTHSVTNMNYMFNEAKNLESLNLRGVDTSSVTSMEAVFAGCEVLKELDLSSFHTSHVVLMNEMFSYCSSLKNVNLSSFNTESVTDMSSMFYGCIRLEHLDLSHFNIGRVTQADSMLERCNELIRIAVPINCRTNIDLRRTKGTTAVWYSSKDQTATLIPKSKQSMMLYRDHYPENGTQCPVRITGITVSGGEYCAEPHPYSGTMRNGQTYAESTEAPVNAGNYYQNYSYLTGEQLIPFGKKNDLPVGTTIRVTVEGCGNYSGSTEAEYRVVNETLAKAKIKVKAQKFTGREIVPETYDIQVKVGKNYLTYGRDYLVDSCYDNINKGKASIVIMGTGKYSGYQKATFLIQSMDFWGKYIDRFLLNI